MDRYLTIEFDSYGFMFNTAQLYVSISWLGLLIATLSVVGYKIYKRTKKGKK
jgi:hypothetical protein